MNSANGIQNQILTPIRLVTRADIVNAIPYCVHTLVAKKPSESQSLNASLRSNSYMVQNAQPQEWPRRE